MAYLDGDLVPMSVARRGIIEDRRCFFSEEFGWMFDIVLQILQPMEGVRYHVVLHLMPFLSPEALSSSSFVDQHMLTLLRNRQQTDPGYRRTMNIASIQYNGVDGEVSDDDIIFAEGDEEGDSTAGEGEDDVSL